MTSPTWHLAYVSIGSNLGDKPANCRSGIDAIDRLDHCRVTATSRFFRTSPVDYLDQDWFVNAAIRVETTLSPVAFLERLQSIQSDIGKARSPIRFGPRELDLDIIFYNEMVLDTPDLSIPHPRMHKRRFVLEPLCDIDPGIVHPVLQVDISTLLGRIDDPDQEIYPLHD